MERLRSIFVGPGGIRAGWRFALFILLAIPFGGGLQRLAIDVLGYRPHPGLNPVDFLVSDGLGFLGALVAVYILARIGRERMGEYGLRVSLRAPGLWGEGLAWGVLTVGALAGLIAAFGGLTVSGLGSGAASPGGTLWTGALMWLATMVVLGLYEEYLFRGYPLVALGSGMGFWPAAILLSLMFGALHFFTKPMETVADGVAVSLIGLFLCVSFRRTGSLWFAAGFHTAFDFVALPLLGAPNTANQGRPLASRLLDTSFHGPAWLTGGPDGMEASLLIFPVLAVLFWLLVRRFPEVRRPLGKGARRAGTRAVGAEGRAASETTEGRSGHPEAAAGP